MIGLKRHTVQVVEYDSAWAELFEKELHAIRCSGGPLVLDVQHVGSTAVPGLPSKPILDIAVAVRSTDVIPELAKRLTLIGFIDRGDRGRDGGYLLVRDAEPEVRTVHLHIVEQTDVQWHRYISFRDILRRDANLREQYGDLKRQLAAIYPNDRKQYTDGKDEFIRKTIRESEQAQQPIQRDAELRPC